MNKHYFFMSTLLTVIPLINAVQTTVNVTNKSSNTIPKVMIKTFLKGPKKGSDEIGEYKGFVMAMDLDKGATKSIDLQATANKATKENGELSKWRKKNQDVPLTAAEYLDMSKLQECKVRTVQPHKEDKETFASRWKNEDGANVYTFMITDNEKEEYKTKKGEKVRRLLKIVAQ